jgi:hypothetical protein
VSENPLDLPTRSQRGLAALDIFYDEFNDVNFYVEDEEQENLYFEVFRKLFKRVRIARIFPLGGKSAVFQHAMSTGNQEIKGFRAYIVDRDFDHFLEKQFVHPNVFYLDRFCIENYVLEPSAIVEVVIENHPKAKRDDVKAKLSLGEQIPSLYNGLKPLFRLFLCSQSLDLGIKNCKSRPEAFCEPKRLWNVNAASVVSYQGELETAAAGNGMNPSEFRSHCDGLDSRIRAASSYQLVSGKFVAAMVFHYVKSRYILGSMTFDSFVYRLAKNCTLRSMRPITVRVRASLKGHGDCNSSATAE